MNKILFFLSITLLFGYDGYGQKTCTPNEVRTEIVINANIHKVWAILTDVAKYPEWHPYMLEVKGTIKKGKMLKFTMKGEGKGRKFSAAVLSFSPDSSWAWGGSLLFFFRARHYFILERIDNNHTRLIQGEYWKGWFGQGFGKTVYEDACKNFPLMNEKLKELAERQ